MARRPADTLIPGDPLASILRDNRRRVSRPGSPFPRRQDVPEEVPDEETEPES